VIPHDQFSINFSQIEMSNKGQKADGTLGAAVTGSWNAKQNKMV
jgi:hypothetical protein